MLLDAFGPRTWVRPEITALGRLPMRRTLYSFPDVDLARRDEREQSPWWKPLDGEWQFHLFARPEDLDFDAAGWDEIAPGIRMAAGLAGEPSGGPVLVFLDCAAGCEAVPAHSISSETIVAPVSGSVDAAGATLTQGDVRVEEPDVEHPALVAGADGAQLVVIFADRRALRAALDDGALGGTLGAALSTQLTELQSQLSLARSAS